MSIIYGFMHLYYDYYMNCFFFSELQDAPPVGIHLENFQGIPSVDVCINIESERTHSCSHDYFCYTTRRLQRNCGCDAQCMLYNDCCPDYEIFCSDGERREPEYGNTTDDYYDYLDTIRETIPQTIEKRTVQHFQYTCFTPRLTPKLPYYMITKCPDDATHEEDQLCINNTQGGLDALVPVYVRSDGLYYANRYCADCHGHRNVSLLEFFSLKCKGDSNTPPSFQECQDLLAFSFEWVFEPMPRTCDPKVINNCPYLEEDQISKACNSYSANVQSGSDTYKNVHCALCNGVNETSNACEVSAGRGGAVDPVSIPLTVLFDFTGGTLQQRQAISTPIVCPEYFTYNSELRECRRVNCPAGAILQVNQCIYGRDLLTFENRTLSTTLDPFYRKVVLELAAFSENITDKQVLPHLSQLAGYFESVNYTIDVYNRRNTTDEQIDLTWNGMTWMNSEDPKPEDECLKNYTTGLKVSLEGSVWKTFSLYTGIEAFIDKIDNQWLDRRPICTPTFDMEVRIVKVSISNFADANKLCNESAHVPKAYGERSFSRKSNGSNTQIVMYFADKINATFESDEVPQQAVFSGGEEYVDDNDELSNRLGNWIRQDRVYFCETIPICPLVTLTKTDYRWQFDPNNGNAASLLLIRSNRIVPNKEIVLSVDGNIQICLSSDEINESVHFYSRGQTLATQIGSAVSLTLLGLVIITYCSFPSLRNIPGKTVLSLSSSLFSAQLLFWVGAGQTSNSTACLIIACFMHFFWLSVFAWTNVLAFDLSRTFGKNAVARGGDSTGSVFKKYSIYGWGMPLGVVGITVALHYFLEVDDMINNIYQVKTACWLRTGLPILMTFGVPVAIALFENVILFTRTVHGIRSTMKTTKVLKENQKSDELTFLKTELYLYIRVSVLFLFYK